MPQIIVETVINANIEVCFDLARDIRFYAESLKNRNEIPVDGKISGLVEQGDEITWETNHLNFMQHLTLKVTEFEKPFLFVDEMVKGEFHTYIHKHIFKEENGKTIMVDDMCFESKYGVFGRMLDGLFLKRYFKKLLITRNKALKVRAEQLSKKS